MMEGALDLVYEQVKEQSADAAKTVQVLLCEDNPGDYVLLKEKLQCVEQRCFEVEWVRTVEEAYAALRRLAHDVALVDYRLIGGSGLDILREAAAIDWPAPLIMLTSLSDPNLDVRAMQLGAFDFICKDDLRPDLLERSIRYNIEKKRLEAALASTNRELLENIVELREANAKIEVQRQRIVSLAYHLASATHGDGHSEWTGISVMPKQGPQVSELLGVWHFTAEGHTVHANEATLHLLELGSLSELQGRDLSALLARDSWQRLYEALRDLDPDEIMTIEMEVVGQRSGQHSWVVMSLLPPPEGAVEGFFRTTVVDITSRRKVENATHYLAKHDSLTGVANRASFDEKLRHATAIARRNGSLVGLLCIDLDRFKYVNDTYGHQAGDSLLCQVAGRLSKLIRESDTVARLGGDEFGIIATNLRNREDARIVADKITTVLDQPFDIRGEAVRTGGSVGFAVFPAEGDDLESLFERADTMLYAAKRSRAAKRGA